MSNFPEKLAEESLAWVNAGLLDAGQREQILARYPASEGSNRFVAILATLGGVLLAVGVILLIGSNWREIGDWTKIGGLLILLVGAHTAGWRCKIAPGRYPKTGDAFFMAGCLLFLAGIGLVSQIFHLNSRPATGVFLWWAGIAAVPWLTGSKGAQFVSLAAFLTWLGWEFATPGGWLEMPLDRYYDSNLFVWVAVSTALGLAVFLSGLGLQGGPWKVFAGVHEKWGLVILNGGLYLLGFWCHTYETWGRDQMIVMNSAPLLVVATLVVVGALWVWRANPGDLRSLGGWLLLTLLPVAGVLTNQNLGDDGGLWSVTTWVTLFVLDIVIIRRGLQTDREGWVNLGLAGLGLNIITRYFDLFGTMLQGGLIFIVAGVIIIALGIFLEKKRRALLNQLHQRKTA